MDSKTCYIGTSGYSYPHWKGIFYPDGLAQAKWLSYYAERYRTVEINATFYRTFGPHVFERWASLSPGDFKFVIKGPKSITRDRRLKDIDEELGAFLTGTEGLGSKLACVIWQMPPSFKLNEETLGHLEEFFEKRPEGIRYAFEFRNTSWDDDSAYELMRRYNVAWVCADSSRFFSSVQRTADFSYYRFHGPGKLYSSGYSDEQLADWARIVRDDLQYGDVYCFFNNDFGGHAIRDSKRLAGLLAPSKPNGKMSV